MLETSEMQSRLDDLRRQILQHPIYDAVTSRAALIHFMQQHVFAVWDFMTLLKRLERETTCVDVVWQPPADSASCRFITEILLGEECDDDGQGGYLSHFELYRLAMLDVGADVQPIDRFLARLRSGETVMQALKDPAILKGTREFVSFTTELAQQGSPECVAAAFFYGREDLIPEMFSRLVAVLAAEGRSIPRFLHYLRRHIEIDGDSHGPLADRLLDRLCEDNPRREKEAISTACAALTHRLRLWDAILETLPTRSAPLPEERIEPLTS